MKNLAILFACLLLGSTDVLAQGQRIYVWAAATGFNTGQSWPNAYSDLQSALQVAHAGDSVWVAVGTYYPTASTDRTVSFEPPSGVEIFGGFNGTETQLTQRDWLAQPTILSGDIGVAGDSTDNSLNVLYLFQPDSTTLLDGLVIRDGLANDEDHASENSVRQVCGGGLYVQAGGTEAYPEIRNCRFEHNTALYDGGGIMIVPGNDGSVGPRLSNCIFSGNRAGQNGGGMARTGASEVERGVDMAGCVFIQNYASRRGGGFMFTDSEKKDGLDLQNCRFEANYAGLAGGGVFMFPGHSGKNHFVVRHTDFLANTSGQGSALDLFTNFSIYDGDISIDSCIFKNNTSNSFSLPSSSVVYIPLLASPESNI